MKAASLSELQKELLTLPPKRVVEVCIRLAKHKKESKELLTYLLFESGDEERFIESIKTETDDQFSQINKSNLYLAKKSLRKILRINNKFIRFSGIPKTEIELRVYFCKKIIESGIDVDRNKVLTNLYEGQLKKIKIAFSKLHEDIQIDYAESLVEIGIDD